MINKGQADQLASYELGGTLNPMVQPVDRMAAWRLKVRGYIDIEASPSCVNWIISLTDKGRAELEAWRKARGLA